MPLNSLMTEVFEESNIEELVFVYMKMKVKNHQIPVQGFKIGQTMHLDIKFDK